MPIDLPILTSLFERYPSLELCSTAIFDAYNLLQTTFQEGHKLLICGNGGSASDSDHIQTELMKGFEHKRPVDDEVTTKLNALASERGQYIAANLQGVLPTLSLVSNSALITAISNDVAADMVFAQQVYGYGKAQDTLLAISTSGNSANVLNALEVARAIGIQTIALTGQTGGKMHDLCDIAICVPHDRTLVIQEMHLPIYHALCLQLEAYFFGHG